jgi:hypothetical protein
MSTEIIDEYVAEFKQMLKENPEFENELFDSDYAGPEFFWPLFKEQAIINYLETNDPALSTEQLKDVHKKMFLNSIVDSMEELRKKGFIQGDEITGYSLTDVAKQILTNNDSKDNNIEI